jgi:FKBP-type peptidyl-prolyl cis-trans isomerase FkpA
MIFESLGRKTSDGLCHWNRLFLCCIFLSVLLYCGCAGKPVVVEEAPGSVATVGPRDPMEIARPGQVEFPDAEFIETDSGLKYRILRNGGERRPGPTDTVYSHYKGWLDDGSIFDSSYQRGEPIDFPLDGVIPGWTEGLQLIGEGGMIELQIPFYLGYGEAGNPPDIPPKAQLNFVVELVKVL